MSNAIVKEIHVACTPAHAYDTFTSRIDLWWPVGHRPSGASSLHLEAEEGGEFYALRDGQRVVLGTVVEAARPELVRYTWNPGRGTGPTEVAVTFVAANAGTTVRVVHRAAASGLGEQWPERAKIFSNAWDDVLDHLLRTLTITD